MTIKQQQILDNLSQDIFYCEQRIQELDTLGAFKSDDEIGWFFKEVKNMSDKLKQYIDVCIGQTGWGYRKMIDMFKKRREECAKKFEIWLGEQK